VYVQRVRAHQALVDRRFLGGGVDTGKDLQESGIAGVQAVIVHQGDQRRQPPARRLVGLQAAGGGVGVAASLLDSRVDGLGRTFGHQIGVIEIIRHAAKRNTGCPRDNAHSWYTDLRN
jgi:hypothetical protein